MPGTSILSTTNKRSGFCSVFEQANFTRLKASLLLEHSNASFTNIRAGRKYRYNLISRYLQIQRPEKGLISATETYTFLNHLFYYKEIMHTPEKPFKRGEKKKKYTKAKDDVQMLLKISLSKKKLHGSAKSENK